MTHSSGIELYSEGNSEAQAKNIPKIYREISPMSGAYAAEHTISNKKVEVKKTQTQFGEFLPKIIGANLNV